METPAHRQLKRLALRYLVEAGCQAAATEVLCPIARFRIDAAGFRQDSAARGASAQTIIIECKQSRGDFLRHSHREDRLGELRIQFERILRSIQEHRIKRCEPHLRRRGSSLFADLDEWDFAGSNLGSYRAVREKLARIDAYRTARTKLSRVGRYKLADQMYLAAPVGVIRRRELPPGWGLLECAPTAIRACQVPTSCEGPSIFKITVPAAIHIAKRSRRLRLLRNIGVAARRNPLDAHCSQEFVAQRIDQPQLAMT